MKKELSPLEERRKNGLLQMLKKIAPHDMDEQFYAKIKSSLAISKSETDKLIERLMEQKEAFVSAECGRVFIAVKDED